MAMSPDSKPSAAQETPEPADAPDASTPPPASPASPAGPPTREYRAMITFTIVAAVILLAIVAVANQVSLTGGLLLGPVLGLAAFSLVAYGLSQRRDWARFAMLPLLWIVLASGVVSSIVALGQSRVEIPIGSLLAIWALVARPSTLLGPVPGSSREGFALAVAAFVGALVPFLGPTF